MSMSKEEIGEIYDRTLKFYFNTETGEIFNDPDLNDYVGMLWYHDNGSKIKRAGENKAEFVEIIRRKAIYELNDDFTVDEIWVGPTDIGNDTIEVDEDWLRAMESLARIKNHEIRQVLSYLISKAT